MEELHKNYVKFYSFFYVIEIFNEDKFRNTLIYFTKYSSQFFN